MRGNGIERQTGVSRDVLRKNGDYVHGPRTKETRMTVGPVRSTGTRAQSTRERMQKRIEDEEKATVSEARAQALDFEALHKNLQRDIHPQDLPERVIVYSDPSVDVRGPFSDLAQKLTTDSKPQNPDEETVDPGSLFAPLEVKIVSTERLQEHRRHLLDEKEDWYDYGATAIDLRT